MRNCMHANCNFKAPEEFYLFEMEHWNLQLQTLECRHAGGKVSNSKFTENLTHKLGNGRILFLSQFFVCFCISVLFCLNFKFGEVTLSFASLLHKIFNAGRRAVIKSGDTEYITNG